MKLRTLPRGNSVDQPRRAIQLDALDWVAIVVFLIGVCCVLSGGLSVPDASDTVLRVIPLLLFLGAVIVFAELLAKSGVFSSIAVRMARGARGRYPLLFLYCVVFATLTTIFLNLDTTAVLLTPIMLATARRIDVPGMPLAMTTVWLANTASLLLPVSNLTNLLGMDRVGLSTGEFAAKMFVPQLVAVALTAYFLWIFHWRPAVSDAQRFRVPEPHRPRDRVIFRVGAVCVVVFVVLILVGAPLHIASMSVAGVMVATVAIRRRGWLAWCMIPWRLLLFVTGLFLVIQTVSQLGVGELLGAAVGQSDGAEGVSRAAGVGAVFANVVNNLPSYIAVEQAIPTGNDDQLFGLLLGTNIGPLITPWASLAILLWHERCRSAGVTIEWGKFMLTGTVTATVTLAATTATYILLA